MGLTPSKPEFLTVLANKQVTLGDTVVLQCHANTENINSLWEKDGQKLMCVKHKHNMKQIGTACVLEISNVQESDEGNYTITLSNGSGSESCSALLRVEIKQWRDLQWRQDSLLNALKEFKISNEVKELQFLLYGLVGAGKSSTINTIRTIFEGRQFINCLAAPDTTPVCTLRFERFRFANEDGSFPFAFNDIMGAEEKHGLQIEDVISALKGHMKEGYLFNAASPLSENNVYYNRQPSLSDQMHCLVYVISAGQISRVGIDFIDKLKKLRATVSQMGIPQVVFMTHVDHACRMTEDNLQTVYKSKKIKTKMHECSNVLGVPLNCVFPILNYHQETHMNMDINCLMLDALTHITHFANDYVIKHSKNSTSHQESAE